MVYAKHLHSFWESGVLVHIRQGCLYNQSPIKTLGPEALTVSPLRQHFTWIVTITTVPEWLYWESTLGTLCLVTFGLHPICFFPLLIVLLFYSMLQKKSQHKHNYMLSLVSPLINHWTWEWSWDLLTHLPTLQFKPLLHRTLERQQTGEIPVVYSLASWPSPSKHL